MFHRLLNPLLFVAFLLIISIGHSVCRHFSRRATPLHATYARHRLARRAFSLDHPPPQRRSIPSDDDSTLFSDPFPLSDVDNLRRSLDLAEFDDGSSSQSINQAEAKADQLWQEFVAPTSAEDSNSFLESSDPDENSDDASHSQKDSKTCSCPQGTDSAGYTQNTTPSLAASGDDDKPQPSIKNPSQETSQISQKKKEADKEKAEREKADKEKADKEKADKEKADKEADDAKAQMEAENAKAQKEAEAAAQKKKEAQEEKDREAAQPKKDPDESSTQQTSVDPISPPKKNPDSYQVTNVQKNPAAPVSTGTARLPGNGNTYSPPSSEEHTGDATFYDPDVGACGVKNVPTDMIVAVSMHLYDTFPSEGGNPNTNKVCGKKIRATYKGRSVEVTVADRCVGCNKYSLDFTLAAFQKLGSQDEGRLHGMTWTWI